jgi:hypothetical protein
MPVFDLAYGHQGTEGGLFSKRYAVCYSDAAFIPAGPRAPSPVVLKHTGARNLMRTRFAFIVAFSAAFVLASAPAWAQYGTRGLSDRATGENYHVELGGYFWNPKPDIVISSESLGIPGDSIDFVNELGLEQKRFKQMKVVLRPGTKHKFRFEYTPIKYDATRTLTASFRFNGQRYDIGVPVTTVLDMKYTDLFASLTATAGPFTESEFTHARAPIPAIGFIGRGYVAPNISITGEFSFFKIPDSVSEDYKGKYYDFDLYGTVNFTDNFGAQAGYRSFNVYYKVEKDTGDLILKGLYFGGVARF